MGVGQASRPANHSARKAAIGSTRDGIQAAAKAVPDKTAIAGPTIQRSPEETWNRKARNNRRQQGIERGLCASLPTLWFSVSMFTALCGSAGCSACGTSTSARSSPEPRRRHAHNRRRLPVQRQCLAHPSIAPEASLPQAIGKDRGVRRIGPVILRREVAAGYRPYPQRSQKAGREGKRGRCAGSSHRTAGRTQNE